MAEKNYTDENARIIDQWAKDGWEWARPISHEDFLRAKDGVYTLLLTPVKPVSPQWLGDVAGKSVLGLACGGGQQMPVFAALNAKCTVLDYSKEQLKSEQMVAAREGYPIQIVRADMTRPLPFGDASFDLIFHPVSNCYIENVTALWKECFRVLKKGGVLLCGLDNGLSYAFDDDEKEIVRSLPFNPLRDEALYRECAQKNWGIQFSHTVEEQLDGQLRAGFTLTNIGGDTSGSGNLHEHNITTFFITRAVKP